MRKKRKFLATLSGLVDNKSIFRDQEILKSMKGNWSESFVNNNPIVLEIGMGAGGFLQQLIPAELALNMLNNYIGMEIKGVRVFKAYRKTKEWIESGILKLIEGKADLLKEFFADGEISRIHLNFSDPWPRKGHMLKRLTSPRYLPLYHSILKSKGELVIKTDNQELFDYSLETIPAAGFEIVESTRDLHLTDYPIKQFETEYEGRFRAKGMPIYYLKARKI